jgi:hypothetical protein
MCCRCRLQASGLGLPLPASPSRVSCLEDARLVELKAADKGWTRPRTSKQGQTFGRKRAYFAGKFNAHLHRRRPCSFETDEVARGCVKGNEGTWLPSDLGCVMSQCGRVK